MSEKLIVTVAPSIPTHAARAHPDLDLSPEGIAKEVLLAADAGANAVHLHVWDEEGRPTTSLAAFERTLRLIRDHCDIIIEGSTGGVNGLSPADRSVSLGARIEMASLNPGSVNYDQGVYVNSPTDIAFWVGEMHAKQIKPNIAIFEAGMISNAMSFTERDLIASPALFTFVLGQHGAMPASPKNLQFLSESVPPGSIWGVAGHGGADLRMSVLSMEMGGHVRAGFEDNPYYRPGIRAKSNAQLVERLVRIAEELGHSIASPSEARSILGITGDLKGSR